MKSSQLFYVNHQKCASFPPYLKNFQQTNLRNWTKFYGLTSSSDGNPSKFDGLTSSCDGNPSKFDGLKSSCDGDPSKFDGFYQVMMEIKQFIMNLHHILNNLNHSFNDQFKS